MSAQGIKIDKKGAARKGSPGNTSLMILFSVTIFVSAALLFLVEPMFAKFVLPTFGGTPAVWTGSMMFFQAALLTSYLYVHATTTWLGARKQAVLHLALVLLPLLVLPLAVPAAEWAPSSEANPIFLLLGLLAVTVGLPFFAISATNPLIQRWLSDTDHPAARDPYFLYRASNLGSVIGLLGYPLVVERELTLANQGIWWSIGYGLLILLVLASAVMLWHSPRPSVAEREEEAEPLAGDPVSGGGSPQTADDLSLVDSQAEGLTVLRRLRWIGLTFVPSSLMLGVTAFLTTDITPIPLLWVIPLSLYLFSFVIVFSPSQRMPDLIHKIMVGVLPVIITTLMLTTVTDLRRPYWALILLHLIGFFVVAMVLHGEVARDRPPARNLTEFYLWVAVGGVLGGVFNALIAPVAFDTVVEYPLAIILACLFVPGLVLSRLLRSSSERDTRSRESEEASGGEEERETLTSSGGTGGSRSRRQDLALDLALPVALGLGIVALGWIIDSGYFDSLLSRSTVWQLFIGLAAAVCLWFAYSSSRPIRFGLGIAALVVAVSFANGAGNILFEDRSFFGVYKVTGDAGTEENAYHALVVGDTNHGAQLLGPQPPTPIAYHDPSGPFGQLFELLPSETTDDSPVSVLGLGAGVMSCYAEPGQRWTYYEIDPAIEAIARNENLFTYLRDCPGEYDVVLGDARLKLAEAEPGSYGMIIGEAFSSDAIPVHMLTREATDMYFDKLNEHGVLLHHISNRHLDLEPVVGDLARDRGLTCYASFDDLSDTQPSATSQYKLAAHFTVLARDEADLGSVPDDPRWAPCRTNTETDKVWTDDYSNLLSTFVFG
ncbi:MAG: fused MFS/spermidine synthase [Actinobacteria bacterium]|nr:fused MFS/spermidine synthase [Actinomycetota bacterium]